MRKSIHLTLLAVIAGASLYSYASRHHYIPALTKPASTSTVVATTTLAGPANLYPNHTLTPGDVLTTDANTVCTSGYSKSVRNVPSKEKRQVYAEYNTTYPQPQGANEVDHFISLELGGSNDIKNLWLEPANPTPGFHEKDKVENYLHQQVCSGAMTLVEAQREIATDWYAVYLKIGY